MQTSPNNLIIWQLFKNVRLLFASDIPWEVQYDSQDDVSAKIALENTGGLIKACMLEIPVHVRMEHFDTPDEFIFFIANDLQCLLFRLQALVHDNIAEYVDIIAINAPHYPELLKLHALGHVMQSLTPDVFDVKGYLKFLYLNQDPSHLRKILTSIETFNKRLVAETSKNGPDRSALLKLKTTYRSTSNSLIIAPNDIQCFVLELFPKAFQGVGAQFKVLQNYLHTQQC